MQTIKHNSLNKRNLFSFKMLSAANYWWYLKGKGLRFTILPAVQRHLNVGRTPIDKNHINSE